MKQPFPPVYPVYILSRVVYEILDQCRKAVPKETLGRLLGYRFQWQGTQYTKIVDWISGSIENSPTHARFTLPGTRECELFIDERYGTSENRPREVGLFHSHPFGIDPLFSSIDCETFLTFPYNQEGNVFILVDPLIECFKVFIVSSSHEGKIEKQLQQVPWIFYFPKVSNS